jgi:hypothetical protein
LVIVGTIVLVGILIAICGEQCATMNYLYVYEAAQSIQVFLIMLGSVFDFCKDFEILKLTIKWLSFLKPQPLWRHKYMICWQNKTG